MEDEDYNAKSKEITKQLENLRAKENTIIEKQSHYEGIIRDGVINQRYGRLIDGSTRTGSILTRRTKRIHRT